MPAEFSASTLTSTPTYDSDSEAAEFTSRRRRPRPPKGEQKKKVLVFGSGPIRIGQGIGSTTALSCVWTLKHGCEAILVNNNETVSTDFDTGDRLYFDPLNPEKRG